MVLTGSNIPRGTTIRRLSLVGVFASLAFSAQLTQAIPAAAAGFSGRFSPTIVTGGADLNGDGVVSGRDDADAFYGDTSIIDGHLDCNTWGATPNAGTAGDGTIDSLDDCTLVGFDGTSDGASILVADGMFAAPDGPLPTVFNASDPTDRDISDADFAWSTINGRVDSNGNEQIGGADCHFGLIGETVDVGLGDPTDGADVLGNPGANECGFATAPDPADNGLVDLNSDADITSADTCTDGCFFGHNVTLGRVGGPTECPGYEGDARNQVVGTSGPDTLRGTPGRDIICGFDGRDTVRARGGRDLVLGGPAADAVFGGGNKDTLTGGAGNDRLNGGRGTDSCVGGPGRDTYVRCE